MEVSVREAARRLGLSARRVRALAAAGRLPARRIDERLWVVDVDAARRVRRPRGGRPLSARSCWAILALAEGREPAGLSASERARARARLAALPDMPPGALAARAEVRTLAAHPGVLPRLAEDERLVLGGVSAAGRHGADILALDAVEAYVRNEDAEALQDRYALRPAPPGQGNVLLRVPRPEWPFPEGPGVAPASVVAVDLIDAGDERSVRAGRAVLRRRLAEHA